MTYVCKRCGEADAALFYASIKTYCKEHWREKVRANRAAKIDQYRAKDRARGSLPHRVAARAEYQKTEAFAASHAQASHKWAVVHPLRRKASHIVSNAIRDGKLQKLPCLGCGNATVEGHHPDYSRPLDVVWLCVPHHKEVHAMLDQS